MSAAEKIRSMLSGWVSVSITDDTVPDLWQTREALKSLEAEVKQSIKDVEGRVADLLGADPILCVDGKRYRVASRAGAKTFDHHRIAKHLVGLMTVNEHGEPLVDPDTYSKMRQVADEIAALLTKHAGWHIQGLRNWGVPLRDGYEVETRPAYQYIEVTDVKGDTDGAT